MQDSLEKVEQIERAAAEIYAHLQRAFASDYVVAALFRRLAEEERQHAEWVRLIREACLAGAVPVDALLEPVPQLDAAHRTMLALRTEARSGTWDDRLGVALSRMADVEAEYQVERWFMGTVVVKLSESRPELSGLFEILDQQTRTHHLELERLTEQVASRPSSRGARGAAQDP